MRGGRRKRAPNALTSEPVHRARGRPGISGAFLSPGTPQRISSAAARLACARSDRARASARVAEAQFGLADPLVVPQPIPTRDPWCRNRSADGLAPACAVSHSARQARPGCFFWMGAPVRLAALQGPLRTPPAACRPVACEALLEVPQTSDRPLRLAVEHGNRIAHAVRQDRLPHLHQRHPHTVPPAR